MARNRHPQVTDGELLELATRVADRAAAVSSYLADAAAEARSLAVALRSKKVPPQMKSAAKQGLERALGVLEAVRTDEEA